MGGYGGLIGRWVRCGGVGWVGSVYNKRFVMSDSGRIESNQWSIYDVHHPSIISSIARRTGLNRNKTENRKQKQKQKQNYRFACIQQPLSALSRYIHPPPLRSTLPTLPRYLPLINPPRAVIGYTLTQTM